MKQLMVYVNPAKKWASRFRREDLEKLARIQIDNSLRLGWKPQDIIVATNFPWEYNGVRSKVVPDLLYCYCRPLSTKTMAMPWLLSTGMFDSEVVWVHDWDAYQQGPLDAALGVLDAGFPTYGWSRKWALGSYLVSVVGDGLTSSARYLFNKLRDAILWTGAEDERALVRLTREGTQGIDGRYRLLNHTYNFGMRHIKENYERAEKPLRVLHFHPHYRDTSLPYRALDAFMYGKSELGFPLMDEGLIEVFKEHGIE